MLLVVPVKPEKQAIIPAVSHMGTARLQTVQRETNPLYHQLIERFGTLTGVPVLLNTSFNVAAVVPHGGSMVEPSASESSSST